MSNLLQNNLNEIDYSESDHGMWKKLYSKQITNLQDKAHPEFLGNLKKFELPTNKIPSLNSVSEKLRAATGWQVESVDGLIGYEAYFTLLKARKFPVAYFIRNADEEDLSKDPDIFHEVFGHCTMLLSAAYAEFMCEYAKFALTIPKQDRPLFSRLIWFTTETGLIRNNNTIQIYGSSILSSYKESLHCLENSSVIQKSFDVINIFREPYRADMMQKVYYVIDQADQVYRLLDNTQYLFDGIQKARNLGELPAHFPIEKNKYTNIGYCIPLEETMS